MVRNAKLVGQSIIAYLQKKGYPEVRKRSAPAGSLAHYLRSASRVFAPYPLEALESLVCNRDTYLLYSSSY